MNGRVRKILFIGGLSLVGVIVIAAIVLAGIYFLSPKSTPKYVAHRGYSRIYLGNTQEAFQAAANMGFYGIETDVHKTKDGVYICNHDDTVKFADGTVSADISESDFADLISKPLKNDKTEEDVYICTFEKYLEACATGNKVAVIELKRDFSAEDLQEILAIVDGKYDRKKISVISFYYDPLLLIKSMDPSVNLQYLSETKDDPIFDRCLEDGISIDVRQSILNKSMVNAFHKAGLTVNTWTVNKKFDLNIVRIKGVDYVTTDVFREDRK